jgi:hypothetical protein
MLGNLDADQQGAQGLMLVFFRYLPSIGVADLCTQVAPLGHPAKTNG